MEWINPKYAEVVAELQRPLTLDQPLYGLPPAEGEPVQARGFLMGPAQSEAS
ncbi:hypothetical protein ACIA8O_16620 [Kitasatospora sp. NPDC051853]|uniref:hypothetical protein n=1 Tax=Kitasatospora sp. NPDC051853 TaxID=3364058 RepID=UPI0037B26349